MEFSAERVDFTFCILALLSLSGVHFLVFRYCSSILSRFISCYRVVFSSNVTPINQSQMKKNLIKNCKKSTHTFRIFLLEIPFWNGNGKEHLFSKKIATEIDETHEWIEGGMSGKTKHEKSEEHQTVRKTVKTWYDSTTHGVVAPHHLSRLESASVAVPSTPLCAMSAADMVTAFVWNWTHRHGTLPGLMFISSNGEPNSSR